MPTERHFDHPSNLVLRPVYALRGLSSLFHMAPEETMDNVVSGDLRALIDIVVDNLEEKINQADDEFSELLDAYKDALPQPPKKFEFPPDEQERWDRERAAARARNEAARKLGGTEIPQPKTAE